jgi:hypothetical protein
MDHTRYRGLRPVCSYVRRAKLLSERLVNQLGL